MKLLYNLFNSYINSTIHYQHPTIFKLFNDPARYTHIMLVIEELPLLTMSTNISGHHLIYRDIKYCLCNLHHLTIFCNCEVYMAIPSNIN